MKKPLTLGSLKKRRLSPVFAGDAANGVPANQINAEFALMKFCDVVAPASSRYPSRCRFFRTLGCAHIAQEVDPFGRAHGGGQVVQASARCWTF